MYVLIMLPYLLFWKNHRHISPLFGFKLKSSLYNYCKVRAPIISWCKLHHSILKFAHEYFWWIILLWFEDFIRKISFILEGMIFICSIPAILSDFSIQNYLSYLGNITVDTFFNPFKIYLMNPWLNFAKILWP